METALITMIGVLVAAMISAVGSIISAIISGHARTAARSADSSARSASDSAKSADASAKSTDHTVRNGITDALGTISKRLDDQGHWLVRIDKRLSDHIADAEQKFQRREQE